MMKIKEKTNKGITIIALVVTIIILLILAGVTIGVATNNSGLFEKAKLAADEYNNSIEKENAELGKINNSVDEYITTNRDTMSLLGYVDYSNKEHIIGVWIDGKPIYQKTVNCGTTMFTTSSTETKVTDIAHNISNIDKVIDYSGITYYSSSNMNAYIIPFVHISGEHVRLNVDRTNCKFQVKGSWNSMEDALVTISYTKTTDTENSFTKNMVGTYTE